MNEGAASGGKPAGLSCLVIIPAHNEARDIGQVIREVRDKCGFPIAVVDDASSDDTAERARKAGARVIPLALQLGAWGALQTGIRHAHSAGYDYALTMDADGQHEAVWIESLMRPVVNGEAGVSIGCCIRRGSLLRKAAWKLMKAVSGLALEDITSGFRVYNREALGILASRAATLLEYQDVGVLVLLQAKGIEIIDVEVTMLPRRSGTSRVYHSWIVVFYYMCHTLLLSFSKRSRKR
jgi:glycosyltransferase involved in cell wall biosynthesis